MGNRRTIVPPGHKQLNGTRLDVLYPPEYFDLKPSNPPTKKVEQAKLLMGIFSAFGIPAYIAGIFWNIDNIKGWVLFTVGFLYAIFRLYFYVIRQKQEKKLRDLEYRKRLLEIENEIFPHQ